VAIAVGLVKTTGKGRGAQKGTCLGGRKYWKQSSFTGVEVLIKTQTSPLRGRGGGSERVQEGRSRVS